jgi:hypothetical protein
MVAIIQKNLWVVLHQDREEAFQTAGFGIFCLRLPVHYQANSVANLSEVMHNHRAHREVVIRSMLPAAGVELKFLPLYWPRFSPIEEGFGKITWEIRTLCSTILSAQVQAIQGLLRGHHPAARRNCSHTPSKR